MTRIEAIELFGCEIERETAKDLVSVLIPAYNHQSYVEFCLESVLRNGYENLEIVIVDDGSTDLTFEIIKKWAYINQKNFTRIYVETQKNMGLARTLNKLLLLSKGKYLTLLASDDALVRNSIKERVAALESSGDKKVIIGNCYIINDDNHVVSFNGIEDMHRGSVAALNDPNKLTGELILNWSIPGPVMLAHRSIYEDMERNEIYDSSLIVEDRYWYLKVLSDKNLAFLNKPVAYYRTHAKNTSTVVEKSQRIMRDIAISERRMIKQFYGSHKVMLFMSYLRSLYILKTFNQPNLLNRTILIGLKVLCRSALFFNRNVK